MATARKTTAKKTTAKETTAKKATAKKATAKKATARKTTARKTTAKKTTAASFDAVYDALVGVLLKHAKPPLAAARTDDQVLVKGPIVPRWKKELWFGAVRRGKAYVSYHLMTLYTHPALAKEIGPDLRRRMQGKSCFNFKTLEPALVRALDVLTRRSVEVLRDDAVLPRRRAQDDPRGGRRGIPSPPRP